MRYFSKRSARFAAFLISTLFLASCSSATTFNEKLDNYAEHYVAETEAEATQEPVEPAPDAAKEEPQDAAQGQPATPSATPAPEAAPPAGNWPTKITHLYGETTFNQAPQRVIALDSQLADSLVISGVVPVAVLYETHASQKPSYPDYYKTAITELGGQLPVNIFNPANLNLFRGENIADVEMLKEYKPDLILANRMNVPDQSFYDAFNAIAPTVVLERNQNGGSWQDRTVLTASIFDKTEVAQAAVQQAVTDVKASAAAAIPSLAGKTYSSQLVASCGAYNPNSGAGQLFTLFGMVPKDSVVALFAPLTPPDNFYNEPGGQDAPDLSSDFIYTKLLAENIPNAPMFDEAASFDIYCTTTMPTARAVGYLDNEFNWQIEDLSILNIRYIADNILPVIAKSIQ